MGLDHGSSERQLEVKDFLATEVSIGDVIMVAAVLGCLSMLINVALSL